MKGTSGGEHTAEEQIAFANRLWFREGSFWRDSHSHSHSQSSLLLSVEGGQWEKNFRCCAWGELGEELSTSQWHVSMELGPLIMGWLIGPTGLGL